MRLITEFFASVPWFLPGIVVWAPAALVLTPSLARALHSSRPVVFVMLVSFGGIILAALTPTAVALSGSGVPNEVCSLDRVGLPPVAELTSVHDTLRNVLLFVPLGVSLGLLARTRRAAILVGLAYALPFAIEAVQLAVPSMGRGCQSADVIDNAIGLTIGLVIGATMRQAVTWWSGRSGGPAAA
ncbi:MAG: VanZ family protein [Chloroflexota bacterium]